MRFHSLQVRSAISEPTPLGKRQHHFVEKRRPVSWGHRLAYMLTFLLVGYMLVCTVLLGMKEGWLP